MTRLGRRFGRFWAGQASIELAVKVGGFAIPVLAVTQLHASAGEVGVVGLLQWLPFLLLALPFGVLVDRGRHRTLLLVAALGRTVIAGTIGALALTGVLTVPLLGLLVVILGSWVVLFEVAYQSLVPALVPPNKLETANSRLQVTSATADIAGPGLGGLLVRWVTAGGAMLFEAVLYAVAAVLLTGTPRQDRVAQERPQLFLTELREGITLLLRDRYLLPLAGFSGIYNLFSQWIEVLVTIYAIRELRIGAAGLGLALSIGAVGAVLGALTATLLSRRFGIGRAMLALTTLECLALAAIPALDPALPPTTIVVALAGLYFLNSLGTAATSVQAITLRQLRANQTVLGRVNAGMRTISYGAIAIGSGLGGIAGTLLTTRGGLTAGGIGLLLTIVWVLATPLARIKRAEDLSTVTS